MNRRRWRLYEASGRFLDVLPSLVASTDLSVGSLYHTLYYAVLVPSRFMSFLARIILFIAAAE